MFSGFPRIISRGVFLLLCERISVSWAGRKERLYISKIAKFEGDFFKTNKDISPQSRVILQVFLSGGEQLTPHDTNVCTFLQLCGSIYFSSLIRHISLKLGNFTNSKGLFPVVSTDILCLVHVWVSKKTWKCLLIASLTSQAYDARVATFLNIALLYKHGIVLLINILNVMYI